MGHMLTDFFWGTHAQTSKSKMPLAYYFANKGQKEAKKIMCCWDRFESGFFVGDARQKSLESLDIWTTLNGIASDCAEISLLDQVKIHL